ncbi:hypothetical protein SEA_POKYPUPPY_101 [Gordonia phage PokyPuppy]|nr:hypothetical protein SEA_POKYPUPPY_101 [Gordonia phage PokyPuppy]
MTEPKKFRLIFMPSDLDGPIPTKIITEGTYRACVRVANYRRWNHRVMARHTSDSDYRTWEYDDGSALVFSALCRAVVHLSNYPAYEAGVVDTINHTVSDPMTCDDAGRMLEQAYVAMEAHPQANVTNYKNRSDYGSALDYIDHEGVAWHMWIDTEDTTDLANN